MTAPICINCKHFDQTDTSLPVCTLHKKYSSGGWVCGEFETKREEKK